MLGHVQYAIKSYDTVIDCPKLMAQGAFTSGSSVAFPQPSGCPCHVGEEGNKRELMDLVNRTNGC